MTEEPQEPQEAADARLTTLFAGCLYFFFLLAALVWLGLRDDLGALEREAVGHGQWWAMGLGILVGLAGTGVLWALERYLPVYRALFDRVAAALGPLRDGQIVWLSLLSAVAESLFFRLAVLQALGFWWSVGLYVILNTGPGFWVWSVVAFAMGFTFSSMVAAGYGLLSVTVAHALINYLTMRRILQR